MSTTPVKARRYRTVGASLAAAGILLATAACGGNDDAPDEEPTFTKQEEALADTQWRKDNFGDSPFYLSNAQVNPQVWVPNDPAGALLPSDYDGDEVFWQMPACVAIPFTKDGPTEVGIGNDSFLEVGGYEHTELGAAAAAYAYSAVIVEADDQVTATERATGLSAQDAQHAVSGSDMFNSRSGFKSSTENCGSKVERSPAYRVASFSESSAAVDFVGSDYTPGGKSAVIRIVLHWDGSDWKLDPQTFSLYDEVIDQVKRDDVREVDTSGFTQW